MMHRLEVAADAGALAERAAAWILEQTAAREGPVSIGLSGGSTPKRLYERLASPDWRGRLPWGRIHLFWGDERFVPADHPDSNQGMVRQAMLGQVPIPPGNIHPIPTDGTPESAAARYEEALRRFAETRPGEPLFDIQLLGLGPDGHTASLFPGSPALLERKAWALAVIGAKPEPRITLTYPALDSSRAAAFLVAGAEKREILARLRAGDPALPAAGLAPAGPVTILADQAAAGP
jgi:6-phosphogluconolactonase